jgi:CHASE2 domain-containing sensor protein
MSNDAAETGTSPQKGLGKFLGKIPKGTMGVVGFFAGFGILILFTLMEHRAPRPEDAADSGHHDILSEEFWYEKTLNTPNTTAKYVTVVTVGRDMPKDFPFQPKGRQHDAIRSKRGDKKRHLRDSSALPILADPCRRRLYIAELLKVMGTFAPKAIVLDLWFDPEACRDQAVTRTALDEIQEVSVKVPVVLGLPAYNPTEIQADQPAEFVHVTNREAGLRSTELVLSPVVHPQHSTVTQIVEAVVERNSDSRKIPLSWPVYQAFNAVGSLGQPQRIDSLAVAAVRAYDPASSILTRVGALTRDGLSKASEEPHPYTSFLREEKLPINRAIDVICSSPSEPWKQYCNDHEHYCFEPSLVTGKVILVGIAGLGGDIHPSLIGKVPGVVLQANYVESLLSGRVFKPVPMWIECVIAFVWLVLALVLAWKARSYPWLALALSGGITLVLGLLIQVFIGVIGYHAEVVIPLTIAVLLVIVSIHFERFLAHLR